MRRALGLVLVVGGCNRLLGIDQTTEIDAAPICHGPLPGMFEEAQLRRSTR